jgi:hypothetical protein
LLPLVAQTVSATQRPETDIGRCYRVLSGGTSDHLLVKN